MTTYFLLAILMGIVLRFVASLGVRYYLTISKSDEELRGYTGFHLSAISYFVGTGLKYVGLLLVAADLIKTYIL